MSVDTQFAAVEVLRLVFDHPDLQGYFRADEMPGRRPLVIVADVEPTTLAPLRKFGVPIVARRLRPAGGAPCLEITSLFVEGGRAEVAFQYRAEGVSGTAELRCFGGIWTIMDFDLWED